MAYDIGPKIGIEGEAEFRKQINNLTQQQKTLATEMQAVTSAFDKNDKSQENLTAQNKVLSKQIDVQKQKLDSLKQGLSAAADKYGENDKVTQGWQQTVNKATADLNKMERQLKDNRTEMNKTDSSTDDAESAVKDFGKSMDKAGDKASAFGDVLGGTLAADGLEKVADSAKDAAKSVLDLAQSSDKSAGMLEAKLGLTEDAAEGLSETAESVWKDGFGDDLDEATDSVATIRQMLGDMADDDLGNVAESALTVKQVFGADVPESVRSAKAMMDNFGISGQEAFDYITVGFQNGLNYSGNFLDVLGEYSVQFKDGGYSADEMFSILNAGASSGIHDLNKVADSAKEFGIRIKDGSTTTQDGLKLLGIDYDDLTAKIGSGQITSSEAMQLVIDKLKDQDDTVLQNQAGVDLFGTQWEDATASGILSLQGLDKGLGDVEGATQKAGDAANDNLQTKFQNALRGIQDSLEPLADQVLDLANNVMPQVQAALQWVADHASEIAAGIAIIVTAAAGLKILNIIKDVTAFAAANPIGIIIVAIATLVTGIITLWNTNEGFRNAVIGAWTAIQQAAATVWGAITTFFTQTIPDAWNSLVAFFTGIPDWWNGIWSSVGQFFSDTWNSIISFITEKIPEIINNIIEWFQELPYNIGYALGTAAANVVNFGVSVWNWVTTELPKIIQGILDWFAQLPGRIWAFLLTVISNIGTWCANMLSTVKTQVPIIINAVGTFFSQLPGKIWAFLVDVVNKVIQWAGSLVTTAATEIPKFISTVVTFFEELPKKMLDIGANIVKGIWDGINGAISWLHDRITSFCSGIVDGFKKKLKIHSPSVLFADVIGKNIALGIGEGFTDHMTAVASSMSAQVQRTAGNMASVISRMSTNSPVASFSGLQAAAAAAGGYGATPTLNYTAVYNSPAAPTPADVNRVNRQNAQRISLIVRRSK